MRYLREALDNLCNLHCYLMMQLNTLFTGRNIIKLNEVDSTNSFALDYIHSGKAIDGTVIWALNQKQGRGQRGNSWHSEPGLNLTFSIVLQTNFLKVNESFGLNKFVSVGIINALKQLIPGAAPDFKIKWPNDLYYNEQKIAGILIENVVKGDHFSYSIIGIGINVNQLKFDGINAGSLALISGGSFSLEDVLSCLLQCIEVVYLPFKNNLKSELHRNYLNNLLGLNTQRNFIYCGEVITATIINVDTSGKLMLKRASGETIQCDFKEIVWL